MIEVRLFLKSGNEIVVEYDSQEEVDSIADVIVDPALRVLVFEDGERRFFIPISNIDYVEVTDV